MKRSKFSEAQIAFILRQGEEGTDQRLFDRALAPPIAHDDRRLKRLPAQLWNPTEPVRIPLARYLANSHPARSVIANLVMIRAARSHGAAKYVLRRRVNDCKLLSPNGYVPNSELPRQSVERHICNRRDEIGRPALEKFPVGLTINALSARSPAIRSSRSCYGDVKLWRARTDFHAEACPGDRGSQGVGEKPGVATSVYLDPILKCVIPGAACKGTRIGCWPRISKLGRCRLCRRNKPVAARHPGRWTDRQYKRAIPGKIVRSSRRHGDNVTDIVPGHVLDGDRVGNARCPNNIIRRNDAASKIINQYPGFASIKITGKG